MKRNFPIVLAVCLCLLVACDRRAAPPTTAAAPAAVDYSALDQLLRKMQQRLGLMHTVARIKWNSRAPIQDPVREKALLTDVIESGLSYSLDAEITHAFFVAQMEAARLIQEDDFERWRGEKPPPFTELPDLLALRKQLDALNRDLLEGLAKARPLLHSREGQSQLDELATPLLAEYKPSVREAALRPLRREGTGAK